MPDPAITTNDDVAKCLRESGVLRAMQQQALEVNLRRGANSQGFDLLHVSHRHHPVVEFSAYLGDLDERHNTVRLRSLCLPPAACGIGKRVGIKRVRALSTGSRAGRLRARMALARLGTLRSPMRH